MDESLLFYHDMHNFYGEALSRMSLASNRRYGDLWNQYATGSRSLDHQYQNLLVEYTQRFRAYFNGIYPISFHNHASDAVTPSTIASILLHLANISTKFRDVSNGTTRHAESLKLLHWKEVHHQSPRLAILSGSFGAGYGPLAAICPFPESAAVACGAPPFLVNTTLDRESLQMELMQAAERGAIALIIQIVGSKHPWQVITPNKVQILAEICKAIHLPLVVDETLTAIRCGAPFGYQREEYNQFLSPDLVIFGKGLKVSGVGVNFDGATLGGLNISPDQERMRTIFRWHDFHTRAIRIPTLLEALHVLDAAQNEDWSGRSRKVGDAVRAVIWEHEEGEKNTLNEDRTPIFGLEALICVERHRVAALLLQGIPEGDYLRLLPVLDEPMLSEEFLKSHVMGKGSSKMRRMASEVLKSQKRGPLWCYVCGDATEGILGDDVRWCEFCCLSTCGYSACEMGYNSHQCIRSKEQGKL